MADSAAKKTTAAPAKSADKADDLGQAEVQAKFDEANTQGFWGTVPDDTPNEHYTLKGVTGDKPTPENQRGKK